MPRGGLRPGAGRPSGSGRFGERATQLWIPESLRSQIDDLLVQHAVRAAERRRTPTVDPYDLILPLPGQVRLDGPIEAMEQLMRLHAAQMRAAVVVLDPHYRKSSPKGRADYLAEMLPLISLAGEIADHVIVWGFPLAVARLVDHQPQHLEVEGWITWVFKNSANRARSWRGAQQVALHLKRPGARLYYDSTFTDSQRAAHAQGKLPYLMTARNVIIEEPLLTGFIRRGEQTGFRGGQKPISVMTPILQMTAAPGDLVIDPTAGSGSTGEAAAQLGCSAILSDRAASSLRIAKRRLAPYLINA